MEYGVWISLWSQVKYPFGLFKAQQPWQCPVCWQKDITREEMRRESNSFPTKMRNWRLYQSVNAPGSNTKQLPVPCRSPAFHMEKRARHRRVIKFLSVSDVQGVHPAELICWRNATGARPLSPDVFSKLHLGLAFKTGPVAFPCGVMIMSYVTCLFRLKVISFVAFSSLSLQRRLHKANHSAWLESGRAKRGRGGGWSKQELMAFWGWGTTPSTYHNEKLMHTPSA